MRTPTLVWTLCLAGCCFGGPSAAVCAEACGSEGTCRVRTEHAGDGLHRCYAGADDECRASRACREQQRCFASEDGLCVASGDVEAHGCARSVECRVHGACHSRDGFCEPQQTRDCAESLQCRTQGRCTLGAGVCRVGDSDCTATTGCELEGLCTAEVSRLSSLLGMGAECALTATGSCENTLACRRDGRCVARPPEGCREPCQIFYCARPESTSAEVPCTESQGTAHLVCAPDGRCMRDASGACVHLSDDTVVPSASASPPVTSPPNTGTAMPTPPDPALTHPHAICSFAVSRDGTTLATGSEATPEHADDPTVGIVLWDVATGSARRSVAVEGGVGLSDQLRRGLAFSSDGARLGFSFHTNGVGVLDVATGDVLLRAYASGGDSAPSFALDPAGTHVLIQGSEGCRGPAIASIYGTSTGGLEACVAPSGLSGDVEVLAWRGDTLHVSSGRDLISIDAASHAIVRRSDWLPHPQSAWAWPSPSGRRVATTVRDRAGVTLIDVDTHARLFMDAQLSAISAFTFDRDERRWAAVSAERRVRAPVGGATLFEDARPLGTIAGPLAPIDWQLFADGVPMAFAPDGRRAIVVRPSGDLERWSLVGAPTREATIASVPGASGLLWPTDDVCIAMGPRLLVFLRASDGTVIARHDFAP